MALSQHGALFGVNNDIAVADYGYSSWETGK